MLPDDRHFKSLFLKTCRDIRKFTRNTKHEFEIHDALLEQCFRRLESKPETQSSHPHEFANNIFKGVGIDRGSLEKITLIDELVSSLDELRHFPSVLASLYEHQPEMNLGKKVGTKSKYGESHSRRKRSGCFYTPLSMAHFIAKSAVDAYFGSDNTQRRSIKILDPSVGGGIFLDVIIDVLCKRNIIGRNTNIELWGIDRDPNSLKLAKRALDIKLDLSRKITIGLLEGDFLLDGINHPEDGYDIIIGNPPYISYYSREAHADDVMKAILKKRYANITGGSLNTFLHFIYRGVELLRNDGVLAYIIPDKLLCNRRYHQIRSFILENALPVALYSAGEDIFRNANVGNAVIILQKKRTSKKCELGEIKSDQNIKGMSIGNKIIVNPACFFKNREYRFIIGNPLITKIEKDSTQLDELAYLKDGINPAFSGFREKVISTSCSIGKYRPVIEGQDIHPFRITKRSLFINYDHSLLTSDLKKRGVSFRQAWIFDSPRKLVNRQTADRLIFALDENRLCDLNSAHNTILHEGVEEKILDFLLGLLNSRLMNYYYREVSHETGRSFPQVHIVELRELPIRIPSSKKIDGIVNIISGIRNSSGGCSELLDLMDSAIFNLYEINEKEKKTIIKATGKEWRD